MRNAALFSLFLTVAVSAQEGVPLFTSDFPPEEFKARREKIYAAIGENGVAVLQAAPSPTGYARFRQTNEFHYLTGIEVPHAYLLLDGRRRYATVYLPHRNEGREQSEGKLLAFEDADQVKKLSGIDGVSAVERLAEHFGFFARWSPAKVLWTPFQPGEGAAVSRDIGVRVMSDAASDPWDGRPSREGQFIHLIRTRFPQFEIRDLSPALDSMRLIKSPREIAMIRRATRASSAALLEAMRSTVPGISEFELDAVAKYFFYRNGAQGDAYYSLIASGPNAIFPHYNSGKRVMKDGDFLLMDYAPDVGYYMSDVTRMWPVNGRFNDWQRELYTFYVACYRSVLNRIRPGATAQAIQAEAVVEMDQILSRTTFSKPAYERAGRAFVDGYRHGASRLGHWVGMAAHDVGTDPGPLRAGMVFTIEPALRVPEENIYIRLEDVIIIGAEKAEIVTSDLPTDIASIEALMKEEGMLQRYPRVHEREK